MIGAGPAGLTAAVTAAESGHTVAVIERNLTGGTCVNFGCTPRERLTPRLLWENVFPLIQSHDQAYIIFDDTVLDKRYSEQIELTRQQYSSNEHRVLRGIGLVNCIYVNPETGQFWVIDYRLYYLIEQLKRPALPMSLV